MADSSLIYGLLIENLPIVDDSEGDNYQQAHALADLLASMSEVPGLLIVANELSHLPKFSGVGLKKIFNCLAKSKSIREQIAKAWRLDQDIALGAIELILRRITYGI
jgi:hypothetical protein